MDKFRVEFNGESAKYIQLSNNIKELIESGRIKDGEKLPTIRALSEFLNVNNVTIVNAYKKLSQEGFALQKIGSGTYAKKKNVQTPSFMREYSRRLKRIEEDKDKVESIVDFAGETSEDIIFPIADLKDIINQVLDRDGGEALTSRNVLGYKKLRNTINKVFWDNSLDSENILILSGAQQGIDIASKVLLNINDNVVVEKPTYGGALSVFKGRRCNIFEVDMEGDGVNIESFKKIVKKNKIKLFYTMSYFQNPTGISYSIEKKKELLNLAEEYDFYIIEDDYLSELIYEESIDYIPFKWLDRSDRVIYLKSFSKIFLPGVRIGYTVPPKKYTEGFKNTKFNTDIATSSLMQRVLEVYIDEGRWKKNINLINKEYKERYYLMKELIDRHLSKWVTYENPKGGLNFYLTFRNKLFNSKKLFFNLAKKGVYITPGVIFFRKEKEGEDSFRIGFSQTPLEKIRKGINIIKEELARWDIQQ